jgi:hypothetical protein
VCVPKRHRWEMFVDSCRASATFETAQWRVCKINLANN